MPTHTSMWGIMTALCAGTVLGVFFLQADKAVRDSNAYRQLTYGQTVQFGYGYVTPVCSNGIVEAGEECDDGNMTTNDGCEPETCLVTDGYTCEGVAPSVCTHISSSSAASSSAAPDSSSAAPDSSSAVPDSSSAAPDSSSVIPDSSSSIPDSSSAAPDSSSAVPDSSSAAPDSSSAAPESSSAVPDSSSVSPDSSSVAPASSSVQPASSSVVPISSSVVPNSSSVAPDSSSVQPASSSVAPIFSSVAPASSSVASSIISSSIAPVVTGGGGIGGGHSFTPYPVISPSKILIGCGNGIVEIALGEECDAGRSNGLGACSLTCKHAFCGDGMVQPEVEECEPMRAADGSFTPPTCGGMACLAPVCDASGCIGGCRWASIPACAPDQQSKLPHVSPSGFLASLLQDDMQTDLTEASDKEDNFWLASLLSSILDTIDAFLKVISGK